jgi:FixJ family two-component response regulator
MTGHDNAAVESQAIAAGAIAYLRKPFPGTILIDALKKAVRAN